jgi:4-hydroxy-tetrahydrodipicolinate reductase
VLDDPRLELVAARCFTPDKEGADIGTLAGGQECGVRATQDIDDVLAASPDCVVFMPRDPHDDPSLPDAQSEVWMRDLVALLEAGVNVVTSIITGAHWRHLSDGEGFRSRLEAACKTGSSTVHFTGFDPGFSTDALAYTMSGAVGAVSGVSIWELIDVSGYTALPALERLGFGRRPEDLPDGTAPMRIGWGGALHLLADALGIELDDDRVEFDSALAEETYTTPGGMTIAAGTISAVRWTLTGLVDGRPVISVKKVTRAGATEAPEWPQLGTDGGYIVDIDAFPPFRGEFPMGLEGGTGSTFADAMIMTAARCVNAVPAVTAAAPGYVTFLDLPPLGGFARPSGSPMS